VYRRTGIAVRQDSDERDHFSSLHLVRDFEDARSNRVDLIKSLFRLAPSAAVMSSTYNTLNYEPSQDYSAMKNDDLASTTLDGNFCREVSACSYSRSPMIR